MPESVIKPELDRVKPLRLLIMPLSVVPNRPLVTVQALPLPATGPEILITPVPTVLVRLPTTL